MVETGVWDLLHALTPHRRHVSCVLVEDSRLYGTLIDTSQLGQAGMHGMRYGRKAQGGTRSPPTPRMHTHIQMLNLW